jgi:hypothetical protein
VFVVVVVWVLLVVVVVLVEVVVVVHCMQAWQNHCEQATSQPPIKEEQKASHESVVVWVVVFDVVVVRVVEEVLT